jgi:hypothetical protein
MKKRANRNNADTVTKTKTAVPIPIRLKHRVGMFRVLFIPLTLWRYGSPDKSPTFVNKVSQEIKKSNVQNT